MSEDNPFLIPPPPPGIAPETAAEDAAQPVDTDGLITVPPGILDSGTYRMPTSRVPKPDRLDDVPAFFPVGVPGSPPAVHDEPSPPDSARLVEATRMPPAAVAPPTLQPAQDSVDGATRASVGRRSAVAWRLVLPDGQQLLLERTTLIGRDPANNAQWPDAMLLQVIDPAKTVSKTHAALELTVAGMLLVHDLDSTNGVYLSFGEADGAEVVPGVPAAAGNGAVVHLGEFELEILYA